MLDLNQSKADTFVGTPSYMSPELFLGKSYNHKVSVVLMCLGFFKKTDCLGLDSMTRHCLNEVRLLLNPNRKRGSRVVSTLASCARGPGFDPCQRRGKFVGPNLLPFVSFAGMT